MILAGIDEAGYGPLLGPLVVGCSAWRLEGATAGFGNPDAELPCIWKSLRRVVSRRRSRTGRKLHVNDSKLVYSPSNGLAELERSILTIARAFGSECDAMPALLAILAGDLPGEMESYDWYRPFDGERFPLEVDGAALGPLANALRVEAQRAGLQCVKLDARVVLERRLNQMMIQTRNKSAALFSIVAGHLDALLRDHADEQMIIVIDRQGARQRHGRLLRLMLEDWALEVIAESESRSDYVLRNGDRSAWLIFVEKAETVALPTALASMLSKYLREVLMNRFNAYWTRQVPGLAPTAGYYTDGIRFLRDTGAARQEMGIRDDLLVRCR